MFYGIIVGAAAFVIIGCMHPVVIKTEYHIGKKAWPLFLMIGLAFCVASVVFAAHLIVSAILAVAGFSFLWGIRELFEQEQRVKKGWFPDNKNKKR